jgi:hypothetical protein
MTPLETIRAINSACDRAHVDGDGVPLLGGTLYRTQYGKGKRATLWYVGNGIYKFQGKDMMSVRGELTKFMLGDDSAECRDVTAGFIAYLLSWRRKRVLIAERHDAARERKLAKDRERKRTTVTHEQWVAQQLAGLEDKDAA